jgi:hypothetical protein
MQLEQTRKDRGSVALTYGCPDCGYEFAMLTNPMETQVVGSLGVKIGVDEPSAGSKCPFTGVVQELSETGPEDRFPWTPEAEARMARVPEFVKPLVKTGIEKFARDAGHTRVDEQVLDKAKGFLGTD